MIQASHIEEPDNELKTTINSLPTTPKKASTTWLKRARIISALVYSLLQTAYFIFIIVCIALYPRCEQADTTPWWLNSVFLRFSTRSMTFTDIDQKLDDYKNNFSMQALWLSPVFPLSNELNPLTWIGVDGNLTNENMLTNLITKAHENNIRIIVDYPLNHLSIQSYLTTHDDLYFVWNEQGNTSNWMTINSNQQSAWTYDDRKQSFYLHQFTNNNDSIDINYRNNRVFNDVINSFSYWEKNFQFDGFNLQGISYAYEDYEYRNETDNQHKRTRHLDEDYLLLARIRTEIEKNKIILLDTIDSITTSDDQLLARYYTDQNGYFTGVQLASLNNFILINEFQTNLTIFFDKYYNSIFFKQKHPLIWSSLSLNSKLNEVFFAACLFHFGVLSIDIDRQGEQFSNEQLNRLRQIITFAQTLDVFRVGHIQQNILPNSQFLTIERTRRGSRHHMIIINFSNREQEDTIELKQGITSAVEVLVTNIENPGIKYETNALIDMTKSLRLRSYEYLIIRWSPSIQGLGIIF